MGEWNGRAKDIVHPSYLSSGKRGTHRERSNETLANSASGRGRKDNAPQQTDGLNE